MRAKNFMDINMQLPKQYQQTLIQNVIAALAEDIGSGDITAELIPADTTGVATVVTRDHAIICGQQWVDEVFNQVDPKVKIEWHFNDGEQASPGQVLFTAHGDARSLLTAERCALNFLQLLSGTASLARDYANTVAGTKVRLHPIQDPRLAPFISQRTHPAVYSGAFTAGRVLRHRCRHPGSRRPV